MNDITCKSDRAAEISVLGVIAVGVMVLAGLAIWRNNAAEASAWTAVLMAIINAIKERWTQRSVDQMGNQLAGSVPPSTGPQDVRVINDPRDAVPVEDTGK